MNPYTRELFKMAYRWMFGENPADGQYTMEFVRAVIDAFEDNAVKSFRND